MCGRWSLFFFDFFSEIVKLSCLSEDGGGSIMGLR